MHRHGFAFCIALAVSGCASVPGQQCRSGEQGSIYDVLYFGTDKPGGVVTAAEWADFLSQAVTPRFPDGLSAWNASGQWKSADGSIVHEASHVLSLVHPDDATSETAIAEIMSTYKTQFQQEAVMRVKSPACVSF